MPGVVQLSVYILARKLQMGRPFFQFVDEPPQCRHKYVCINCSCDVASDVELVWKGFMATEKPAFLFSSTVNIHCSPVERKEHLTSGVYVLSDVQCRGCATILGWRYLKAIKQDNAHKEGATLVEVALMRQVACQ